MKIPIRFLYQEKNVKKHPHAACHCCLIQCEVIVIQPEFFRWSVIPDSLSVDLCPVIVETSIKKKVTVMSIKVNKGEKLKC